MSIVTQCPSCGTKFRVTPPQLQAQHGMVRCGRCAQVFDGFKTLATLADTAEPPVTPAPVEPALVATKDAESLEKTLGATPSAPVAVEKIADKPAAAHA